MGHASTDTDRVYHSSLKFLTPLTPEQTYRRIVEEAIYLTGGKYGSIFLPVNGSLERVYTNQPMLKNIKVRSRGYTYKAFTQKTSFILTGEKVTTLHPELSSLKITSDLTVSLNYEKLSIGVLSIFSPNGIIFGKKELSILKLFAPLATIAIKKAHLYADVKNALDTRDLFISLAAHELRTPLTSLFGYTQLISKQIAKGQPIKQEFIKKILAQEERLKSLINEMLQVSRIKTGKLSFQKRRINLQEVIKKSILDFKETYPHHNVFFKSEDKKFYIKGDAEKLFQALSNILHNAGKFSPKHSSISIDLSAKTADFLVKISDQGQGIASSDLPHIFERFYRGKNIVNSGLGLGLFLVKEVMEQHQGTIRIDSTEKKGTTVRLFLPKIQTI